jgi:hypothetical protein
MAVVARTTSYPETVLMQPRRGQKTASLAIRRAEQGHARNQPHQEMNLPLTAAG